MCCDAPFAGNVLTTDAEMWDYMRQQALAHPELALGGPSLGWLKAALAECHALTPTALARSARHWRAWHAGKDRRCAARFIRAWRSGRRGTAGSSITGAEHEVLMERARRREQAFFDRRQPSCFPRTAELTPAGTPTA